MTTLVHRALGPHVEAEPRVEDAPGKPTAERELVAGAREQAEADETAAVFAMSERGADG
jgi:hypothetical protein